VSPSDVAGTPAIAPVSDRHTATRVRIGIIIGWSAGNDGEPAVIAGCPLPRNRKVPGARPADTRIRGFFAADPGGSAGSAGYPAFRRGRRTSRGLRRGRRRRGPRAG